MRPCVLGIVGESLAAYPTPPFRKVQNASQLAGCDVALERYAGQRVDLNPRLLGPLAQARALLPYRTLLAARFPYVIYSRRPLATVLSSRAIRPTRVEGDA